jgi:hypothetical protein
MESPSKMWRWARGFVVSHRAPSPTLRVGLACSNNASTMSGVLPGERGIRAGGCGLSARGCGPGIGGCAPGGAPLGRRDQMLH